MKILGGVHKQRLVGWRKIANAVWDAPNDPQIYGALDLDAAPALRFIAAARARGHHVTATHLVGRAIARALVEVPDLNVRIVGDHAIARESVDVFFITSVRRRDLTGVKIVGVDAKSAIAVGVELDEQSRKLKSGNDREFARTKRITDALPRPLLRRVLRFGSWLVGVRARKLAAFGLMPSPFGSAMVSSVGMLGLPTGFSPLAWMYRVPLLVLVGEIVDRPVARDGRVEVGPVLPITATIDHRYVDGAQIAEALGAFRAYLAEPDAFEPRMEAPANASA